MRIERAPGSWRGALALSVVLGSAAACGGHEAGPRGSETSSGGARASGGAPADGASSGGSSTGGAPAGGGSHGGASQVPDGGGDASIDASSGGRAEDSGARGLDAAVTDGAPGDAEPPGDAATTAVDCSVAHRVDGVLTNLVGGRVHKTSGALDIATLCFRGLTANSFSVFVEVVNRSSVMQCDPRLNMTIEGYRVLLSALAPRYQVPGRPIDTVTSCLPPGETAVALGPVPATVPPEFALRGPAAVNYSVTATPASTYFPHPGASTVSGLEAELVSGSYVVSGTLKAGSLKVSDVRAWLLFRDPSGLIRNVYFSPGPVALEPGQEQAFSVQTAETTPFAELLGVTGALVAPQ